MLYLIFIRFSWKSPNRYTSHKIIRYILKYLLKFKSDRADIIVYERFQAFSTKNILLSIVHWRKEYEFYIAIKHIIIFGNSFATTKTFFFSYTFRPKIFSRPFQYIRRVIDNTHTHIIICISWIFSLSDAQTVSIVTKSKTRKWRSFSSFPTVFFFYSRTVKCIVFKSRETLSRALTYERVLDTIYIRVYTEYLYVYWQVGPCRLPCITFVRIIYRTMETRAMILFLYPTPWLLNIVYFVSHADNPDFEPIMVLGFSRI